MEKININEIENNIKKLRTELEAQLNILSQYASTYELVEATETYYNSRKDKKEFIDTKSLKFNLTKYFIQDKQPNLLGRNSILTNQFVLEIEKLTKKVFNNEDYVLVFRNDTTYINKIIRQLITKLNKNSVAEFKINSEKFSIKENFVLGETIYLPNGVESVTINKVIYDVCVYKGPELAKKNILLLGTEIGLNDELSKLIIESNPKSVFNLLVGNIENKVYLHDNVD